MTMEMEGPLAPWATGLAQELRRQGYAPRTVVRLMAMARRLSRRLQQMGVGAQDLSSAVIDKALAFVVRTEGGAWGERPRSVPWLVGYLSEVGAMPPSTPPVPKWRGRDLVERYRTYMLDERGVTEDTVETYVRAAVEPFLKQYGDRGLDALDAVDVTGFVTRRCRNLSYAWSSHTVAGLRSFLNFALVQGMTQRPLAAAVPSVAHWRGAGLPQFLTQRQVADMLATCDRRRSIGRRDYAILVLLVRLGLRSGEVSGLCLDDINWRAGEIEVRGKGNVVERLPLPPDVGEAIAAYLKRGRPRRPEREVFLRTVAPLRGLTSSGVAEVVRTASERAGAGSFGPHRLRHTAATEMLRRGGSLSEVAQVLRHRTIATTAGYAKVDHLALRGLAMAWPGSGR
jgi:integrase/recombinase XerD